MKEWYPPWDDRSGMWTPEIRAMERDLIKTLREAHEREWAEMNMPKGAEKVTKDLDLLVEMDEPEQLVRELAARAGIQGTTRGRRHDMWEIVVKHALACAHELEEKNEPSSKGAIEETSPTE